MTRKKISLLLLVSPVAFCAPPSNHFNFDVSADSRWSDNARKEDKKENLINERQDEYHFAVDGVYRNEWISLKSQYDVSRLTFSENSQPDAKIGVARWLPQFRQSAARPAPA